VNVLVAAFESDVLTGKVSTKDFRASLPSAVKNQALHDAQSVFKRSFELGCIPVLKKPICQWNNQNWRIEQGTLILPAYQDGKTQQMRLACADTPMEGKAGALRIKKKRGKWIADITFTIEDAPPTDGQAILGVDLGIKVPAAAHVGGKGTRFFGNGRCQRHMRRRFYARRKKLQQANKTRAVRKSKGKEAQWMKNINHQLSRQIVNHAHEQGVGVIKVESLSGIRKGTTRKSRGASARKNNRMQNTWSFYQLTAFITYKAERMGIRMEQVHPRYIPEEELTRLMGAIRTLGCPYQRTALLIARWSGARRDEIRRLEMNCLDSYSDGTPRLRISAGKTYQERLIPLHEEAAQAIRSLQAYRANEPTRGFRDDLTGVSSRRLFVHHGKMFSAEYLFVSPLQQACAKAGLVTPDGKATVTAQRFRHTVGTQLAEKGARLHTIMKVLGHTSASMSMVYAQISDQEVRKDYQAVLGSGALIAGPAARALQAGELQASAIAWLKTNLLKTELELGRCLRLPQEGPCECDLYLTCAKFVTTLSTHLGSGIDETSSWISLRMPPLVAGNGRWNGIDAS
jgi:IS605 OrfB family transposase